MRRSLALAAFLASAPVTPLVAQRMLDGFARWEASAQVVPWGTPSATPSSTWEESSSGDYRYEGLLIGGAAFGALGAVLGHSLTSSCPTVPGGNCSRDRLGNAVALGLVGAAVGGGLGYLIGRLSRKPPPRSAAEGA